MKYSPSGVLTMLSAVYRIGFVDLAWTKVADYIDSILIRSPYTQTMILALQNS